MGEPLPELAAGASGFGPWMPRQAGGLFGNNRVLVPGSMWHLRHGATDRRRRGRQAPVAPWCLTHLPTASTPPMTPLPLPSPARLRRLPTIFTTVATVGTLRFEPHLAALHEASSSAWTARDPGPPPPAASLTRARTRRSWLWAHGSCLSQTSQVPAGSCHSLPGHFLSLPAEPPLRGPPAPAGPPDYTSLRPTPITLRVLVTDRFDTAMTESEPFDLLGP